MDLTQYRASSAEQNRTQDLLHLMPAKGVRALDIGARDGHFSRLLAQRFEWVTAIDLARPRIDHPRIECLQCSAADMPFPDASFDLVFCAEVLEHIPPESLGPVCHEAQRVASDRLLIGVPCKQDIRVGRTTCYSCGQRNPPWGHVNSFDERRIVDLFSECEMESVSFVGTTRHKTNALSAALMDFAGNPYGSYDQEEACIACGRALIAPPQRSFAQKVATRLACWARAPSEFMTRPRGNWMHLMLRKKAIGFASR